MSARGFQRDERALQQLVGLPFDLTVAADSLKFAFDPRDHRRSFLWVDPMWLLENDAGRIVLHAAACPQADDAFRAWAAKVAPIREETFQAVAYEPGHGAVLELSNGWRLHLLDGELRDDRYDDFYWRE